MRKFDFESIKKSINLIELISQYTPLKRSGKSAYGPCPKCRGDDRLVAYPDRFLCRICHPAYGDTIEFARWMHGLTFHQAVMWLTNNNPPTLSGATHIVATVSKPRPLLTPPSTIWQQRANAFITYAQSQLWQSENSPGLNYLTGRGLTGDTIKAAGLGYNPADITDKGEKWGLIAHKKIWLPAGVVIPWFIDDGLHRVNIRLLHLRQNRNGRQLKYIGPSGWNGANPLYNTDSITPHKPVILVEGEFCALTIRQEADDLITAVATGSMNAAQAGRWIARLASVPLVLIALDAEPGKGDKAAKTWLDLLPNNTSRWRPLLKDINDMHQAGLNVREWIKAALPNAHS